MLKKNQTTYQEQNQEKVTEFLENISNLNKEKFVYIDETGIDRRTIQTQCWTKKGNVKVMPVQGKRTLRDNIIAASSKIDGIIAPFIFKGSCNSQIFIKYVEEILCPVLKEGQIVIMDNASFHKSAKIKELIEARKCQLIYLPPYSPEHNPIEHYWYILKKKVKKIRENFEDILDCISMSIYLTRNFNQS